MGEQISENGELKSEDCKWGIVPLLRLAHYETVDIASQEVARCDSKPEGKHLWQMGKGEVCGNAQIEEGVCHAMREAAVDEDGDAE